MVNVKKHLNIPIQIERLIYENDALDKEYDLPIDQLCYIEEGIKTVLNEDGEEVIINTTVYLDGSVAITHKDLVVFESNKRRIVAMDNIRDKKGKLVLRVVYL